MLDNIDGNGQGREGQDQDEAEVVDITILPDGRVLIPRDLSLADVAKALGDEKAELFCRQAGLTDVIVGKRMCG